MANEKRLIYLEDAIKLLRGKCVAKYPSTFIMGLFAAADEVAKLPTVDAVEVVHGHWISLTDCSNAGVYCSVCGKKVWKEDYAWCNRKNRIRSNYCPHCGSRMDGDGNA